MNESLIHNWNEVVDENDYVYVLGDVAMGKIAETLPLVGRLNGIKFLIPGNHDRVFDVNHSRYAEWHQKYLEAGFSDILHHLNYMHLGDYIVNVNHFPYEGDSHDEDRFTEFRPTDDGNWLLHGHVHEKWLRNGRMINVGVDVWDYHPASAKDILAVINRAENHG
jgi:calcineurin-like phosphoesterase family protein